jgi:hypothetical protein
VIHYYLLRIVWIGIIHYTNVEQIFIARILSSCENEPLVDANDSSTTIIVPANVDIYFLKKNISAKFITQMLNKYSLHESFPVVRMHNNVVQMTPSTTIIVPANVDIYFLKKNISVKFITQMLNKYSLHESFPVVRMHLWLMQMTQVQRLLYLQMLMFI